MLQLVDLLFVLIVLVLILGSAFLYFLNVYHAIISVSKKAWSITLVLRVIGIFFPIWGIFMGFIKND